MKIIDNTGILYSKHSTVIQVALISYVEKMATQATENMSLFSDLYLLIFIPKRAFDTNRLLLFSGLFSGLMELNKLSNSLASELHKNIYKMD